MNFTQLCFSFKGRISRKTYWLMQLLVVVIDIMALMLLIELSLEGSLSNIFAELIWLATLICLLTFLVTVWARLAVMAKRWHDRDKSAWWILINLVPIIGHLWSFVELGFFKGTLGKNRFGLDPLQIR